MGTFEENYFFCKTFSSFLAIEHKIFGLPGIFFSWVVKAAFYVVQTNILGFEESFIEREQKAMWHECNWQTLGTETFHLRGRFCFNFLKNIANSW